MYRLILSSLILLNFFGFAQQSNNSEKSILIFSSEPGYLRPFIEANIKKLINTKTGKPYFKNVYSLNNFNEDIKLRAKISSILWKQENAEQLLSLRPVENKDIQYQKEIIQKLTEYDYFLTIKTNTLEELIEFQFQLFTTLKATSKSNKNYLKRVFVDSNQNIENIFINPKSSNYLIEIENAIQRLFINSNKPPEAELFVSNKRIISGDTLLLPLNEKIVFDGSNSGDYDSETISYYWRNIPEPTEKYQTFQKLSFEKNKPKQEITISSKGPFKIGFKVFDGVNFSEEITFLINTINKPNNLKILDTTVYSYHKKNLFNLKPELKQKGELFFIKKRVSEANRVKPIISESLINDFFLENDSILIEKNLVIENYLDQKINKINIISEFPAPEINNVNQFYLYTLNKNNLISKPIKIEHKLVTRSLFTIHIITGPMEFGSNGSPLTNSSGTPLFPEDCETCYGGQSFFDLHLGFGLLLTENIELGISFGLINSQKAYYQNYEVDISSKFDTWLNYTILTKSIFKPYLGIKLNTYSFKDSSIDDGKDLTSTLGGNLGVKYPIINNKNMLLDLRLELSYEKFIMKELNDLYAIKVRVGPILRL